MTYQVNEIFTSVQGEGMWTGMPATFIRLQGCTVGCPWCDTKYTWAKGGSKMTVDEILKQIETYHVVITGGEPTIYNLDDLLGELDGVHYTQLETSGQNSLKGNYRPDWLTWSPKKNLNYDAPNDIKMRANEVKWVVDDELTFDVVNSTWKQYFHTGYPNFVFMPEGTPPTQEHVDKALSWLKNVPFELRHLWRFGDRVQWRIGVR